MYLSNFVYLLVMDDTKLIFGVFVIFVSLFFVTLFISNRHSSIGMSISVFEDTSVSLPGTGYCVPNCVNIPCGANDGCGGKCVGYCYSCLEVCNIQTFSCELNSLLKKCKNGQCVSITEKCPCSIWNSDCEVCSEKCGLLSGKCEPTEMRLCPDGSCTEGNLLFCCRNERKCPDGRCVERFADC
jgi:hypothetical protein